MPEIEICKNNEGSYDCEIICKKGFTFNTNLSSCVGMFIFKFYLYKQFSYFFK